MQLPPGSRPGVAPCPRAVGMSAGRPLNGRPPCRASAPCCAAGGGPARAQPPKAALHPRAGALALPLPARRCIGLLGVVGAMAALLARQLALPRPVPLACNLLTRPLHPLSDPLPPARPPRCRRRTRARSCVSTSPPTTCTPTSTLAGERFAAGVFFSFESFIFCLRSQYLRNIAACNWFWLGQLCSRFCVAAAAALAQRESSGGAHHRR